MSQELADWFACCHLPFRVYGVSLEAVACEDPMGSGNHQQEPDGADNDEVCRNAHNDECECDGKRQSARTIAAASLGRFPGTPACSLWSRSGSLAARSCSSFSRHLRSSSDNAMEAPHQLLIRLGLNCSSGTASARRGALIARRSTAPAPGFFSRRPPTVSGRARFNGGSRDIPDRSSPGSSRAKIRNSRTPPRSRILLRRGPDRIPGLRQPGPG